MTRMLAFAPIAGALLLLAGLGLFLSQTQKTPAGSLVGAPLPAFTAAPLTTAGSAGLDPDAFRGGPIVLNVWASWCAPCRTEHVQLTRLAAAGAPVYGLIWRDAQTDAQAFLDELGDPFARLGLDPEGEAGRRLGVQGVPETFIIDADGVVVTHIQGPLTPDIMARQVVPQLRTLGAL